MDTKEEIEQTQQSLTWRGNAPVSERFDDVYYSAENGLEESRFVFLHGIGAPDVWANQDHFVIAETGFGTGLNFLATWNAWRESGSKGRLTFISVEGYPMSGEALADAHQTFPELNTLAEQLRGAWPPAAQGFHPRSFDGGKVRLLLLFGDAVNCFSRLHASVDAWYLDGFAPAKNPDMWSDDLMDQIARLSKTDTRFATFTAAGFVRRALLARGFHVEKQPGYGRKRERLVGKAETLVVTSESVPLPEWAGITSAPIGRIGVIGSGIAGACVGAALAERGRDVTLISSPDNPKASDVPAAILAPRFVLERSPSADVFSSAYALSCCFPAFEEAWADVAGVELVAKNIADKARHSKLLDQLDWDESWITATQQGLMLPRGGTISPNKALEALATRIPHHVSGKVTSIRKRNQGWLVCTEDGKEMGFDALVIAAGVHSPALLTADDCPEIRPNRGQVEMISPPYLETAPDHSLAYGGYITAETDGCRTIGSTFDRTDTVEAEPRPQDRRRILADAATTLGSSIGEDCIDHSWVGVRATTPDHLPYAGPVPDGKAAARQYADLSKDANLIGLGPAPLLPGLYMLTGLGSKGFQYGPLMADFLAAQICGDPLPLSIDAIPYIHPMRDLIRRIKRKKN